MMARIHRGSLTAIAVVGGIVAAVGVTAFARAGLVPGGGAAKSDCYAELDVTGITSPSDRVQKNKIVLCTDGEACDTGACGDNQCDIQAALCINQTDPNLPGCTPPVSLQRVKVRSKGKVKLNIGIPSTLTGPQCTGPVDATIPVKLDKQQRPTGPGKTKVNVTARASKGTKPRTDGDEITIVCLPRTVACPAPTTTTAPPTTSTTGAIPTTTSTTSSTTSTTLVSGCFTDTGDGTIRDGCTGLQWEKKTTTVGSGVDPAALHDVDNRYTWAGCCDGDCSTTANYCQPDAAAAATCAAHADGGTVGCSICTGTCDVDPYGSGAITTIWDWINQVNAAEFAGHSDWRLPSEGGHNSPPTGANDLETILLAPYPCGTAPCIALIFGPTASSLYWSSTSNANRLQDACYVNFSSGSVNFNNKPSLTYVRAVRGGS